MIHEALRANKQRLPVCWRVIEDMVIDLGKSYMPGLFLSYSWTCESVDVILHMGVSKNRGTPKWMIYNGNPYENGWFGGTTIFGNPHISFAYVCLIKSHANNKYYSQPLHGIFQQIGSSNMATATWSPVPSPIFGASAPPWQVAGGRIITSGFVSS